jgi:hypothetical protein
VGRSSRVLLVVCCLILVVVPVGVLADGNLVVNGDFEAGLLTDLQGWTHRPPGQHAEINSGSGRAGTKSLHTTYDERPSRVIEVYQAVPISTYRGRQGQLQGYMYADSPVTGSIAMAWTNSEDCVVDVGLRQVVESVNDRDGVWIEAKATFVVPTTPAYDYLCIYLSGEDDQLYFDDISVTVQDPTAVRMGMVHAGGGWGMAAAGVVAVVAAGWEVARRKRGSAQVI